MESDRINDKEQFTDSYLIFTGVRELSEDDDETGAMARLRQAKAMFLPDGSSAQWLTKAHSEEDTQVLADNLRRDIHKFSMVPDMTDINFSGTISGVAMRFMLFGFEQLTRVKELWFREGLRGRMRIIAQMLYLSGGAALDPERVRILFSRALPANELELAQTLNVLRGLVPDGDLLTQVPFVSDAKAALAALNEQRDGEALRTERAFGRYGHD
jgi:SPP1 family phage portal protein